MVETRNTRFDNISIVIFFIIVFLGMIILTLPPVSAEIQITTEVTTSGIMWNWSPDIIIESMSINGITNPYWDNKSSMYRLNNNAIEKNSGEYTIRIYSTDDYGENTSYLPEVETTFDASVNIVLGYLFFIIAIICLLIGTKIPFIAWVGVGFSIIGIVDMQNISFWGGFVFMCVTCSGIIVAFNDMNGA